MMCFVKKENYNENHPIFVTGCWDIKRDEMDNTNSNHDWKRSFSVYTNALDSLLGTGIDIIVFGENNIKDIVQKHKNAKFINYPLSNFKKLPFFEKLNIIRNDPSWYNNAEYLSSSPQGKLEFFNPIIMSKIYFVKQVHELFKAKSVYWIDAGITRTHKTELITNIHLSLSKYNKFLFMRFPYTSNQEIHGFLRSGMNKYCNVNMVNLISRAQFFGGSMEHINEIVNHYNSLITDTLNEGYLGTEESIFTILYYQHPHLFDSVIINQSNGIDTLLSL